jgi:hypothetical protein
VGRAAGAAAAGAGAATHQAAPSASGTSSYASYVRQRYVVFFASPSSSLIFVHMCDADLFLQAPPPLRHPPRKSDGPSAAQRAGRPTPAGGCMLRARVSSRPRLSASAVSAIFFCLHVFFFGPSGRASCARYFPAAVAWSVRRDLRAGSTRLACFLARSSRIVSCVCLPFPCTRFTRACALSAQPRNSIFGFRKSRFVSFSRLGVVGAQRTREIIPPWYAHWWPSQLHI